MEFSRKIEGRPLWRPFFMAIVTAAITACAIAQPAHAAMRGFIVTNFDGIRVEAPVRIIVTTGGGAKGMGEGDRKLLDKVRLSVSGGLLTVRMEDGPGGDFGGDGTLEAPLLYLSTSQLRRVTIMGGAAVRITELAGLEADLIMNGNGELAVDKANVERLNLYVSGGGRVMISGSARTVTAAVNGGGILDATELSAHQADLSNQGPGSIRITVNGPANVTSTGSGDTHVSGNAACTVDRTGVGRVVCGN